jgi:polysaccharide biosynthesis/export protein
MAVCPSVAVLRDIQTLFDTGTASGLSDRQLLERFASRGDASAEAAFEVLVLRHGPMVLRVCRNVLGNSTDAQDAFQATFLVLVRRYGSIRRLDSVGDWLYGVACRVAARARVEASRRRAAEQRAALRVVEAVDPPDASESDPAEFGPVIQEEVRRLPEKYRAVIVLCYWQGLTQEQAAMQLGCPLGTVRSRLARSRDLLRRRLTRRGLATLAEAIVPLFPSISAGRLSLVPNVMTSSTVKAGVQVVSGRAMTGVTSTSVAVLAQSVLRSLFMMKLKIIAASLVLVGIGAFGASLAAPQTDARNSGAAPGRGSRLSANKPKSQHPLVSQGDYVVEPPDVLVVEVREALPGRPISGERLVRPDGKITLGLYGDVYVAGLTLQEVKEKIVLHLREYLTDTALGLVQIDSETLGPKVDKDNKPIRIDPKDSNTVFVTMWAYNSKYYYVLGDVLIPGRMSITGNETVLDAIYSAGGLTSTAAPQNIRLVRPAPAGACCQQVLPVNLAAITSGGDPTTNYQIMPGDRLIVPRRAEPKTAVVEPEPAAEQPTTAPPNRRALPLEKAIQRTADRVDDSPALRAVQRRLSEVERKLDVILEVLKSRNP